MTPDITVYTVILGDYDNLRPPEIVEPGVRYVCISDEFYSCPPWELWPAWKPYKSEARNSRIPKILSHLFFDSEYTIYHDGSFVLKEKPSVLVDTLLSDSDIAMFRHPCRSSVYQEAGVCEREKIGAGPEMAAQIERYRAIGLGDGLWAGGFIARRNTTSSANLNEMWWREFLAGSTRDQIALPAAKLITGINIHTIDADILMDSQIVKFAWHAGFIDKGDNYAFEESRGLRAKKQARLMQLCI